jgi:hypothetical protein
MGIFIEFGISADWSRVLILNRYDAKSAKSLLIGFPVYTAVCRYNEVICITGFKEFVSLLFSCFQTRPYEKDYGICPGWLVRIVEIMGR